jgi:hypothetical protein
MRRNKAFSQGVSCIAPKPTQTELMKKIRELLLSSDKKDHLDGLVLLQDNPKIKLEKIFKHSDERELASIKIEKAERSQKRNKPANSMDKKHSGEYANQTVHMTVLRGHGCS